MVLREQTPLPVQDVAILAAPTCAPEANRGANALPIGRIEPAVFGLDGHLSYELRVLSFERIRETPNGFNSSKDEGVGRNSQGCEFWVGPFATSFR